MECDRAMYGRTMKNLRDGDRWHTPCLFRPQTKVVDHFEGVTRIRKTVGISLLILVCVAALSAPVAAHHSACLDAEAILQAEAREIALIRCRQAQEIAPVDATLWARVLSC